PPSEVESFAEVPGRGICGRIEQHEVRLGSRAWLTERGIRVPELPPSADGVSCLAIDGRFRGAFTFGNALRPETERCLAELSRTHELTLLSGDNERERARFEELFGGNRRLHFNQTPSDKLSFIKSLQDSGKTVMMVGDGLNDAGALKQSDVGVAVVERAGAFSPASDLILEGRHVPQLARILKLARSSVRIVHFSFGISALYNLVGISVGAAGFFSPVFCAILMPISSISVTLFACGATAFAARRAGLSGCDPHSNPLLLGA
ncbi:MAG: HAD-IC family P-type ATPase, partial [Limisphaerales bacterium]